MLSLSKRGRQYLGGICCALGLFSLTGESGACTIVRGANYEQRTDRAALRKADWVLTVDTVSEDYVDLPSPERFRGSLRVGVGFGKVVKVHKGPQPGKQVSYLISDGEDAVGCPADAWVRPGGRYKLYLVFSPGAAPPMIIHRHLILN